MDPPSYGRGSKNEVWTIEKDLYELVESLEQLRWLENGLTIQTAVTNIETIGIDTPDDLVKAEEFLNSKYKY